MWQVAINHVLNLSEEHITILKIIAFKISCVCPKKIVKKKRAQFLVWIEHIVFNFSCNDPNQLIAFL